MIEDYKIAIGHAWLVRQEMMALDKRKMWPYHLPQVAATDEQIFKAEQHLGIAIDSRYKAFLKCANGWPAFYQAVDLFGTDDLIGGTRHENAEFVLSYLEDGVLNKSDVRREDLLPIAATKLDRDLFTIIRPTSKLSGSVIWFAGEEIDRFPNFDDFFLAMVEYNRIAVKRFKAQESV
jgi:SMI1 / KNR4 family (SUKH-1)